VGRNNTFPMPISATRRGWSGGKERGGKKKGEEGGKEQKKGGFIVVVEINPRPHTLSQ